MTATRGQMVKRDESETPATEAQEAPERKAPAPDTFPVCGRIGIRGDGSGQGSYNLLILDAEACMAMDALAQDFPDLIPANPQTGEYWATVTVDPAGKAKLRQAGRNGATKIVVEGVLTVVDIKNNKPEGSFRVSSARPATLNDGGRIVTRMERERPAVAQTVPTMGLRARR